MVSLRRRCNLGLPLGNSIPVEIPVNPSCCDSENPVQTVKRGDENSVPSAALGKPVEDKEGMEITVDPAAKRQKTYVQIDPENPMEVHAYLMQLKEKNKLNLGPMQRSDEMPVKEWMEEYFPHVFRVFPQDPKVFQFNDESKKNEFLFANYWLFLFEVRNMVKVDLNINPKYMVSLIKVIENLEKLGFDCRFMRSELVFVGNMMKQQLKTFLAEKTMITTRIVYFEGGLENVVRKKEAVDKNEGQKEEITPEMESLAKEPCKLHKNQSECLGEQNKFPFAGLEKECFEVILEHHRKILKDKEGEIKRINQVLEEISRLLQGKATLSGL